jgi:deazaflavin-dependent oxidoreductase (nitroreductase family)
VPLPHWLARFNRSGTNRVTRPVAGYLPGFAIVLHKGRRSGRLYRTPVNAFRHADGFVIALTYGDRADWVRNVMAAGSCRLQTRGRTDALVGPEIVVDAGAGMVPPAVGSILRLLDVDRFMVLTRPSAVDG